MVAFTCVALALVLVLAGCTSSPKDAAKGRPAAPDSAAAVAGLDSGRVRIVIEDVGARGEDLYDLAKAGRWAKAAAAFDTLRGACTELRAALSDRDTHVMRLDQVAPLLAGGIEGKSRSISMRGANAVTWIAADLAADFGAAVPVEVARLDFFGRELEIGSEAGDLAMLQRGVDGAKRDWDSLRPTIEARDAAEARTFDRLMTRVEAARTPADFGKLAMPILDEVDNLERVFAKH